MTYYECIKQITSEEIFDGLLGFGLFSERLPPFLTSEPYLNYAKKHASPNEQYASQFMFYDNYRNINIPRILAIPSPISYRNLCRSISDNWEKIQNFFQDKTRNQSYKISRIHIRKLAKSKALFKMNYDNWKIDGFPEPDLLIDKKFLVKADIANCFPSMYTHSLCWALVGKNEAKKNKNNSSLWYNALDVYSQKIKDMETHGFLIGPHASNLLSEIILTNIDYKLAKKWTYIRYIDDYTCYVKSKEETDSFLLDLIKELKEYDLLLNQKKTEIIELPKTSKNDWKIELQKNLNLLINHNQIISYTNIRNYLDSIVTLSNEFKNASILSYAFKIISGYYSPKNKKTKKIPFSKNAIEYLKKITIHYVIHYPYLIHFFEDTILIPFKFTQEEIATASNLFFNEGYQNKNYEMCSYALLYSIKNNSKLNSVSIEEILESNDSILMLIAYLYYDKFNMEKEKESLEDKAKQLAKHDFGRFWLFIYETLSAKELPHEYKALKKAKVTFIDRNKLSY